MLEKDILGVCETIALKSSLGDHGRYRITKNFFFINTVAFLDQQLQQLEQFSSFLFFSFDLFS